MNHKTLRCVLVLTIFLALTQTTAQAQIFSPGPLGKAHAALEGMKNCTQCHDVGKKVDGALCLKCHTSLQATLDRGRGFHSALQKEGKSCLGCHKDHRGEAAALADWGGAIDKFDHRRTGFTLLGKHGKAKCEACHRAELVKVGEVKKQLTSHAGSSYLGLEDGCPSCHFDEHRGQLGKECERCHDTNAFKPAPGFKHDKAFKLTGAHVQVECTKCHPTEADDTRAHWVPAPVKPESFARYKPVGKGGCVGCHKDVHLGKFGHRCDSCHTTDSWERTHITNKNLAFHDKTRFPLVGKHQAVACDHCHPKDAKGGIQNKGFPFAHCNDCHLDAHFGQVAKDAKGFVPCDRCHNEEGFYPTRFAVAEHDKSRYPLLGAHRAVPCNGCHKAEPEAFADKVPTHLKETAAQPRGTELLNFTRLKMPERDLGRCDGCHKDPHGGQFAASPARACDSCHKVTSFTDVAFDHDRDARFALVGKHRQARCGACHRAPAASTVIAYRDTPKRCASCHVDVHQGQFASQAAGGQDCGACHTSDAYKPSLFTHANPKLTDFALEGKHAALTCGRCHPKKTLKPGVEAVWYRGLPKRCDGCHENIHAMGTGGKG